MTDAERLAAIRAEIVSTLDEPTLLDSAINCRNLVASMHRIEALTYSDDTSAESSDSQGNVTTETNRPQKGEGRDD